MNNPERKPYDDASLHPSDEEFVAYLDGELDEVSSRRIEEHATADPVMRTKIQSLRKTYDLLDYLPMPEPSADFATKTVTQILQRPGTPAVTPSPATHSTRLKWAGLSLAACASIVVGLVAGTVTRPPASPVTELLTPDLLPVLARLPFYTGVDDIEFLRKLDRPDLFGSDPDDASSAPVSLDRSISAELQARRFEEFRSLPSQRRQEIVILDRQFRELPETERHRLGSVLEDFAVWLNRLPEPLRTEVVSATGRDERFTAVETALIKERIETLPAEKRQKLKLITNADEKASLLKGWFDAEQEQRQEWHLAARQWQTIRDGKRPWPFAEESLRAEIEGFVKAVFKTDSNAPRLTADESRRLEFIRRETERDRAWFQYGAVLLELADRHPSLPEPKNAPTVTQLEHLPKSVQTELSRKPLIFQNRIRPTLGKWPEFALAINGENRSQKLGTLPPLGPCRPGEFREPVERFLTDALQPRLTPVQMLELRRLEGRWPEYPRKMLELAKAHDLSVPGVTLPGSPRLWQQYYRYTSPKPEMREPRPMGN
jgi:hypothetical protein